MENVSLLPRWIVLVKESRLPRAAAALSLLLVIATLAVSPAGAASPGSDDPTWSSLPSLAQLTSSLATASSQTTLTPQQMNALEEGNPFPDARENAGQKNCGSEDETAYEFAPCVYGDTSSKRIIAVVGDSEADMWIPTFDIYGKEFGFKIERLVMDGCTAWEQKAPKAIAEWSQCEVKWKKYCVKEIYKLHPYAVVATGMLIDSQANTVNADPSTVAAGIDKYFSAIAASKAKLFVLSNIPWDYAVSTLPRVCVDIHNTEINACDSKLDPTMDATLKIVQEDKVATVVPVSSLFCSSSACPIVDGEIVLYSDNHHMSHSWATDIPRAFSQIFNPLLGVQ